MKIMHDMEMTDDEQLDMVMPMPMDRPRFPCNLRFSLTHREFAKLPDIDPKDAVVDGMFHFFGMARITNVSHGEDGNCCVECQMVSLGVASEDAENEAD
jgi:hypothetical protein